MLLLSPRSCTRRKARQLRSLASATPTASPKGEVEFLFYHENGCENYLSLSCEAAATNQHSYRKRACQLQSSLHKSAHHIESELVSYECSSINLQSDRTSASAKRGKRSTLIRFYM